MSPEHLAKLPQNQKGYKCPKRQKGVYIYDLDMNFVNKYNTLKEAAEFIGVAFQVISYTVLKSKSHKCKNYYVFREEQNRQEGSTEGNS
ncbi:GIY-YIG nuclease family protein [Bacteroides phage PhiCrAssBcn16]|nr:GIY-YIG nuclease family protein [Bacteroides phage PhiCrAssBcn16]